ncbi:1,4-alpha-glucan branching enzyme [Sphingobium sp. YR768]|nr:1,4-alpha-glucan branching enzyme [Sphingobium sp. YR768]
MPTIAIRIEWLTGLKIHIFSNLRLYGSWDSNGSFSDTPWTEVPMSPFSAEDGCPAWSAVVQLEQGQSFRWGIRADSRERQDSWGIVTEVPDPLSASQYRTFRANHDHQVERYYLTHCRRLGANKRYVKGKSKPRIEFACRAPHAADVQLVIGEPASGYITPTGTGVQASYSMIRDEEGIWRTAQTDPVFARFSDWDHKPYMYRIVRDDGSVVFRSDMFARCQIGSGRKDPASPEPGEPPWDGTRFDLKGTKSCSVAIDPERVTELLDEGVFPETRWLDNADFWKDEFDPARPVPASFNDLVIYELHVEGLGFGKKKPGTSEEAPGTFEDAIAFLDHLVVLGINAVELLPPMEAEAFSWGYGTSHHFATEYAGGGRDQLKHFIRACHQRGIAVIFDVVYNHWVEDAERSPDLYDSIRDDRNFHYWHEGRDEDWPTGAHGRHNGGYIQNGSSGRLPNLREEGMRKLFTSSACMWLTEFHVDGFRVDLTQAFHRDNVLEGNGQSLPVANQFGIKFLREWVRTVRFIKPSVMLVAEDHSDWPAIIQPQETGGIGFDAIWWAQWYHNLIGDSQSNLDSARLLHVAGQGSDLPLAMDRLGDKIAQTAKRVVYHESHDQAGNATYSENGVNLASARTIQVAVNNVLVDETRFWAEARTRAVAGLSLLTPGVPMFFMGEEVGAQEPYRYHDWIHHREDLLAMRQGGGARLFAYYQDVIGLRHAQPALRSAEVMIVHSHNANRVLAYRTWQGDEDFLVALTLNNGGFPDGYVFAHPAIADGLWREVLNSDDARFGGSGMINSAPLQASDSRINPRLPANAIIVLQRETDR